MGKILILNGSPRAPRSNSKRYAQLFSQVCPMETAYFNITGTNHDQMCREMEEYSQVLFVFPLYADSIPVTLLNFLKTLEEHALQHKPTVSVLINCGFLEPEQNEVAVEIMRLFCSRNGYPFGSVLEIGSGEAILDTPFRFLVRSGLKKLAAAMVSGEGRTFRVSMPLSKGMFLKASTRYWTNYGRRNGVTKEQMASMKIEE